MNSIAHESPIEIIRRHPPLSAELARVLAPVPIPGKGAVTVDLVSNDASNVVPAQFTADMVTMVRDRETRDPLLLIVIEPQGRSENEKNFSWPAYLGNLREAHMCTDALLIVVCWNETEAAKCRRPIQLGHPGFTLEPIVIGPKSGPDPHGASPWLTVLCAAIKAMPLDTHDARRAVLNAVTETGSNITNRRRLTTIIMATATDKVRHALEALMQTAEYKIDYFDRVEAQGEVKALLKILKSRRIDLTDEQLEQVKACGDPEQVNLWIDRALDDGASAEGIFKE